MKTVVSHYGCGDGIASAMILCAHYPEAELKMVTYGQKSHIELEADPDMIFCDMTPPEGRVQEFVDKGAVCLDHHEHNAHIVAKFGNQGIYRADLCGAELALMYIDPNEVCYGETELARLVGVYDLWKTGHEDWWNAVGVTLALKFFGYKYFIEGKERRTKVPYLLETELNIANILVEKVKRHLNNVIDKKLYRTRVINEVRVAYYPASKDDNISLIGHHLIDNNVADVVLAYFDSYDGRAIRTVRSLRSKDGIDVGALCVATGLGGGHACSAGFTTTDERSEEEILGPILGSMEDNLFL